MDFLKAIFGDKSLTYAELEAALKDNKEIKIGNLATGQYVDKAKLDGKITELETANTTIQTLRNTVKEFDGVDVKKLQSDLATAETKYNSDIGKIKLESAIDLALISGKAKNAKAVKALLNLDEIKLDGNTVLGLDAQLEKVKTENSYMFEETTTTTETQTNNATNVTVSTGGSHQTQTTTDYDKMSDADYYAAITKKKE